MPIRNWSIGDAVVVSHTFAIGDDTFHRGERGRVTGTNRNADVIGGATLFVVFDNDHPSLDDYHGELWMCEFTPEWNCCIAPAPRTLSARVAHAAQGAAWGALATAAGMGAACAQALDWWLG